MSQRISPHRLAHRLSRKPAAPCLSSYYTPCVFGHHRSDSQGGHTKNKEVENLFFPQRASVTLNLESLARVQGGSMTLRDKGKALEILLVEDNPDDVKLVQAALSES